MDLAKQFKDKERPGAKLTVYEEVCCVTAQVYNECSG